MRLESMSVHAISEELGNRIRTARLNANLTQAELAEKAGLSKKAIVNCEKGKSKLESVIAALLGLGIVEQLNSFIPPQEISPLQLAKLKGQERKRASGNSHPTKKTKGDPTW